MSEVAKRLLNELEGHINQISNCFDSYDRDAYRFDSMAIAITEIEKELNKPQTQLYAIYAIRDKHFKNMFWTLESQCGYASDGYTVFTSEESALSALENVTKGTPIIVLLSITAEVVKDGV